MPIADSQRSTKIKGACPHDCPDTCAWLVTVEDGIATAVTGDPDHPFTRGGLCAKVAHFPERVYSPQRILHPLRRVGAKGQAQFERVTWTEALDGIADRLNAIVRQDGATAVLPYSYLGTQGVVQCNSLSARFFARLGATRLEREICGSAAGAGITATNGTTLGMLPEQIIHSRLIILWGTNTIVTNLHLWHFIRQARRNGAQLVVIDPQKTRTALEADLHIQPLPGTDAALALGLMHVIVREQLHDFDYVRDQTIGFEQLCDRIASYTPDRVASITGLAAEQIERLALAYASTRPACIRTFIGMEHHSEGGMAYRTISCLPALTGAWKDLGGGLLHSTGPIPFAALNIDAVQMPQLEDKSIRSVNMVQIGRALTNEAMKPPIRALIVFNSNPAAIAPNQKLVLDGLKRENLLTVVLEQFMTDTARYADYVLPATTQFEHLDLMWAWGQTYLALNQPAIPPIGEALSNTEIFRQLAARMGFTEAYLFDNDEQIVRSALSSSHPWLEGITYERLQRDGWAAFNIPSEWKPFATGNFSTPSGKCELHSPNLESHGFDPLPAFRFARESPGGDTQLAARYPLILMSSKSELHFLNSSYANLPRQLDAAKKPMIDIHPEDARSRGISDGNAVRVFNDRAGLTLTARVGDRVRQGVVSVPSGWWPSLSPEALGVNALTADGLSDMGGGGDFHDTLVDVAIAS